MVQLIGLSVWRHNGDQEPIRLAESVKLDQFSIWTRGSIRENLTFACRTIVKRTERGCRQTVGLTDVPFKVHIYVRFDGLTGIVVSDEDYPQRVCFALISQTLDKFTEKVGDKWQRINQDQDVEPGFMKEDLQHFQDPKNDKINKIQSDLDEIKDVMHKNMNELLKRGETLDTLLDKSSDVSMMSKQFYHKAKKTNSCCKY
jgi:synaptobrevin family protein YKT6